MSSDHELIHQLIELFEYKNQYQQQTSEIQPQDMYVLERIFLNKNISAKAMTERYHIPASTLTGILDRLERRSLIHRIRSSHDRRSILLATTEQGDGIVEGHLCEDRQFAKNLLCGLDMEKRNLFRQLLTELIAGTDKNSLFCDDKTKAQADPEES